MTDPYRARTEETWAKARADYLAGDTADRVCARYDLGTSSFHKRAAKEGWRKADQPDPEPLGDDDDDLPDADLGATADLALRRMAVCVRRGRAAEALRWQRLHAGLSERLRADTARAEAQRRYDQMTRADHERDDRLRAALPPGATRTDYLKARLDDFIAQHTSEVDKVQEVQRDSDAAQGPAPLNRSERRRRLKMVRTGQGARPEPPS